MAGPARFLTVEALLLVERPTFEVSKAPARVESVLHLPEVSLATLGVGHPGGAVAEQALAAPES